MSDSDSSPKKGGVPSWQLKLKETTPTEGDTEPEPPSREKVVEQAKKFLEEDEVRNASTDKKIAFLESKGLQNEEIQSLLGITRNPEATSSTPQTSPTPPPSQSTSQQPTQSYTNSKSTPPIITYPEFLTTPTSPSPLVTKSRLLTTLYLFGSLSALLYGTNTYLITPMLAQLTTSRLSLAETASSNLQTLIRKIEGLVSEIPVSDGAHVNAEGEAESEDEDPTEMFHRDIGVQTEDAPSASLEPVDLSEDTLSQQTSSLTTLSTSLSSLLDDSTTEGSSTSDLTTTISILREYLDGLAYVAPSYGYGVGGYGGFSGSQGKEDDEIARVKGSIRGVKGVLLSARSFPGGGAGTGARVGR